MDWEILDGVCNNFLVVGAVVGAGFFWKTGVTRVLVLNEVRILDTYRDSMELEQLENTANALNGPKV